MSSHSQYPQQTDSYKIPFWRNRLGRFVATHPRAMIRLSQMESRYLADRLEQTPIDRPIYIAGLARAGSTILLECLASHRDTATHRYRDFPLVATPYWWNCFVDRAGKGSAVAAERFHRDRIRVTTESPEAMEEILWMTFFPACHDPWSNHVLTQTVSDSVFEAFYRDHLRKMLYIRRGNRYVAKGNYNVTRLGYLANIFPDARLVIPFRNPRHQIASLCRQHGLFCEAQNRDPRILSHLRQVGHFEFGFDFRPINLGDTQSAVRTLALVRAGAVVEAYARLWAQVYGFVATNLAEDRHLRHKILLVSYDRLCDASELHLTQIYAHCELRIDVDELKRQADCLSPPTYYQTRFSTKELQLIRHLTGPAYDRLLRLCDNQSSGPADNVYV